LHTQAKAKEPGITPTLMDIARLPGAGLRDPGKQLRGISSMQEQLAASSNKPGKAPETRVDNALRYVIVFPEETFTEHSRQALELLQRSGFTKMRVNNHFVHKNPTFRGVSAVLATEDGFAFAVQFHTPASYDAKAANHDTYKNSQKETRNTKPDHKLLQDYRRSMQERYQEDKVPIPNDVDRIHNFAPLSEVDVRRGGVQGRGDGSVGPPPPGSGERPNRSDAGASATTSTRPHPPQRVQRELPKQGESSHARRKATDVTSPRAGLSGVEDRDGREGAVAAAARRVRDQPPPVGLGLDHAYGPLVGPSWVKTEEQDAETRVPRINPVWYRLSDMPPEVMSSHTNAKWIYGVDAEGHIRIGSANLSTMLSDEELAEQYGYHHQGQQPSDEQLEKFRKRLDGQGHPTIAVEFGADGQISQIDREHHPQSRVSGEIVWNREAKSWEVNINSGRYMHGNKQWSKTRKPRPTEAEYRRWLGNVADRLSAHLGVPVTTAAKPWG
jgi:hypothetical protein